MTDRVEAVRRLFESDPFAAANGIRLVELQPGLARTCVEIDRRHWNCFSITHGGVLFTLAAIAFAAASNTGEGSAVGINMSIACLKSTDGGTLTAEATEVARSRRLATGTVRVTNDAGELVAIFQGTAYIRSEPLPG